MLVVISPSKSINFETSRNVPEFTVPELLNETEKLAGRLKTMSPGQLSTLLGISAGLGELNFKRYQQWQTPFTPVNAKPAVLVFSGDVYQGLDAATLTDEKLIQSQTRLRILSGLYGILKPLDLIQPYRLEMGTKLKYRNSANLYEFWKSTIVKKTNQAVAESGSNVLINLASDEYFKSIDRNKLRAEIVTPVFKDLKNGSYKVISFFAKRARGLMTRFIIENNITDASDLLAFDKEGYIFNSRLSTQGNPVFTRDN